MRVLLAGGEDITSHRGASQGNSESCVAEHLALSLRPVACPHAACLARLWREASAQCLAQLGVMRCWLLEAEELGREGRGVD